MLNRSENNRVTPRALLLAAGLVLALVVSLGFGVWAMVTGSPVANLASAAGWVAALVLLAAGLPHFDGLTSLPAGIRRR